MGRKTIFGKIRVREAIVSFIFIGRLHDFFFSSSLVCDEPLRSAIKAAKQKSVSMWKRRGVNVPTIPVKNPTVTASQEFTKKSDFLLSTKIFQLIEAILKC